MRISVTERQTFKRCRRKWEYTSYNRLSLSPIVNAPALDLGTLSHQTLAAWTQEYANNQAGFDPIAYYKQASQEYFQALINLYTERVGCAPSSSELGPTIEAVGLGLAMIENYKTKWKVPIPAGFSLVANEQALVQPIPYTRHCAYPNDQDQCACEDCKCYLQHMCLHECSCQAYHELECTFDGLMADANGDLYIIERKTFGRTPGIEELNNNDQFLAYQWAANQAFGASRVVGVAYDGLLKKPKPSGVHKILDDLFLRRILLRPQAELAEFEIMLAQEANDMANPSLAIYKTVPPVMGCQKWECSFLDLCHATSKGEPLDHLMKMFARTDRKSHLNILAISSSEATSEVEP
jgi:hypothetical protein